MENQPKNHVVYGLGPAKKFRLSAQLVYVNKASRSIKTKGCTIKFDR